jgi:predicted phosphodiesterase
LLLSAGCTKSPTSRSETAAGPNPWTERKSGGDPEEFRFAVVADRTGAHRPGVFESAISKLNLLRPEFVVSVGDLIEGYTEDRAEIRRQWDEVLSYVAELEMPFFFVPGNHDITNPAMAEAWERMFGRRYYSFLRHNVLFLCLDSQDGPKCSPGLGPEQIAWAKQTLDRHRDVRWTLVFLHQPLWLEEEGDLVTTRKSYTRKRETGFAEVQAALADRPHTVLAGHLHEYVRFVRNGRRFVVLGSTGGTSQLRGPMFGEFDHVAWVTMTRNGPKVVNLLLDGILEEDVHTEEHVRFVNGLAQLEEIDLAQVPVRQRLTLRPKNPFPKLVQGTLSWSVEKGSKWAVEPDKLEIALGPGEARDAEFTVAFTGELPEFFPLPALHIVLATGGKTFVDKTRPLPVNLKPFLEKNRRTAVCRRLKAPPKIDGTLDEETWKRQSDISDLAVISLDRRPAVATQAWLAYDENGLYLAARCSEPNLPGLVAETTQRDGQTFKDDSIELFIDTALDRKTYFQFVVNAAGALYDGFVFDAAWNGESEQATGREKDAWTLEMAIPWRTLRVAAPSAGTKMGLEFVRTRGQTGELQQWAPTAGGNHVPGLFGTLEFGAN